MNVRAEQRPSAKKAGTTLQIQRLTNAMGAEIFGVDLTRELTGEELAVIKQALLDHVAIFFPNQLLSPADITRVAGHFGELGTQPDLKSLDGFPYIYELRREASAVSEKVFGEHWHTDGSIWERPCLISGLYAREVPPHGGDTLFVNTSLAYDSLSDGMKKMLDKLSLVHAFNPEFNSYVEKMYNKTDSSDLNELRTEHPLVRTHPETGRRSLYLNPFWTKQIAGLTVEESAPILSFLNERAVHPRFQLRYRWKPATLGIWDNRCSMHCPINDYRGESRSMYRFHTREPHRPI